MNLVAYLHELAAAPESHPEATALLASKMREALDVTNEMARLVIRYQGLIDRLTMPNIDTYELRVTLGELAANVALRVALLAALPDGPAGAAVHAVGLFAPIARRGPISRDEAVYIARRAAMAHEAKGLGPGRAPHYLAGASEPGWQPHEWVIDAVVAAAERRSHEFPRPSLTRDAALALGRKHAPAEAVDDPYVVDGQKYRRRVEPWMIDAIVEASR